MGQHPRPEYRFERGRFWRSLPVHIAVWMGMYAVGTIGVAALAAFATWSLDPFALLGWGWVRTGVLICAPLGAVAAWMTALVAVPRPLPPQPPRKGTH